MHLHQGSQKSHPFYPIHTFASCFACTSVCIPVNSLFNFLKDFISISYTFKIVLVPAKIWKRGGGVSFRKLTYACDQNLKTQQDLNQCSVNASVFDIISTSTNSPTTFLWFLKSTINVFHGDCQHVNSQTMTLVV